MAAYASLASNGYYFHILLPTLFTLTNLIFRFDLTNHYSLLCRPTNDLFSLFTKLYETSFQRDTKFERENSVSI